MPLLVSTVLMFYLSWMISIKQNKNAQFYSLLSKSLTKMIKVHSNALRQYLFSAHYHSLFLFFQYDKYQSPDDTLEYLRDFYSMNIIFPPESFQLIYTIFSIANQLGKNPVNLFAYIEILCEEFDRFFPSQIAEEITLLIMHSISRLELSSLSLFSHLSKHLSFETKGKIFSIFGNSIWLFLKTNPPFLNMKNVYRIQNLLPPVSPSVSFSLCFWDGPGFTNGVNLNQQISFPETVELIKLISDEIASRITLIIQASCNESFLITTLLSSLSELLKNVKDDKYLLDFSVTFLLLCSLLPEYVRPKEANILISPPFFHPSLTVFHITDDKEYEIFNTIRYFVIQILMKSKLDIINNIFMKWIHEPLLFAEITHRIIQSNVFASFDFNDADNNDKVQSLCRALMISSLHYQKLHYSVEQSQVKSIEIARTSILLLISSILNAPNALSYLFSDSSFDSFYFSFLFEVPLRSFVLSSLLSFLSKQQKEIPLFLISILEQILTNCFSSFPEEMFVLLANDVLTTLNESFLHQRSITDSFSSFLNPLITSYQKVEKSEVIENFMLKSIQFFSLVAHSMKISRSHYNSLSKAISIVFDKENIPQKLTVNLIQLIAGDQLSSLVPTFCIRHTKAVTVLLTTLLHDSKLLEMVKFVDSLVLFLHYNAIQLRHAKFDLFLIQIIREQKDEEIINAMLNLFQHISSVASSIPVVQSFISLLSPFEGRYYSDYQQNYIQTLKKIVTSSSKDPFASIPMIDPSNAIEITGLNKSDIETGFTFIFWILNDHAQSQYKPSCLFLQDSKMNTINAFISSSYIFCYEKSNNLNSTGKIDHPLPPNQWTFVALTFNYKSPTISYVIPTFGVNNFDPIEYIPMNLQPGPLTVRIGGTTDNSVKSDCISKIATFGMFQQLDIDTITVLYQMGPRGIGTLPQQPLFYYTTDENNGLLSVKEKFVIPTIKCHSNLDEIPLETNFTKILVDFCKCQILLPLYSQIDMTMKNGNSFPIEKVTNELFITLLSNSMNAQFSFNKAKGVEILSHLLKNCNENHIDYPLYLQFYQMMQGITYPQLQEELLKLILLDTELWLRSDADNHMRILKHWDRTLFPTMMTNLTTTFKSILLVLRIYYWYELTREEREYDQCTNRCRGEELNVAECRQLLSRIAVKVAIEKFEKDDFFCIVNHCLTCAELQQVIDLLQIIKSLALSDPSPLANICNDTDIVSFLHLLLPRESNTLLIMILEILLICYHKKLAQQPPLQDQMQYIIDKLSPTRISRELFNMAVELIQNGYYEMFQFCCWMGLNDSICGSLMVSKMITNQIHPMKELITYSTWSFWPIVFCFHVDVKDDLCQQLLLFLSTCDFSYWKNLFSMIHNVGLILNKNSNDMKALLLHSIAQFIISNGEIEEEHLTSFFVICKRFILYRRKDENSMAIESYFKNSPFNADSDENQIQKENSIEDIVPIQFPKPATNRPRRMIGSLTVSSRMIPRIPVQFNTEPEHKEAASSSRPSNDSIKDKIQNSQFHTDILQFALRFDEECHWKDAELAKEIISVYLNVQLPQFLSFDLLLCAFLMHESPELVCDHIFQLEILNNVDLESSNNNVSISSFSSAANIKLHHVGSFSASIQSASQLNSSGSLNNFDNFNDSSDFSNSFMSSGTGKIKVQKYVDLLNHHCQMAGFDFIIEPTDEPLMSNNAFKCLEKVSFPFESDLVASAKKLFLSLKNEASESPKQSISLFIFVLGDLVGESRSQIMNGIEIIMQNRIKYEKLWTHLWRSLSIDPAPWSYNLCEIPHYQRDQTWCRSMCPFKMRRNWNFNHKSQANLNSKKTKNLLPSQLTDVSLAIHDFNNPIDSNTSLFIIPCNIVTPKAKKLVKFSLFVDRIELLTYAGKVTRIPLFELIDIYLRKSFNVPNSIELFTMSGKSFFVQFTNHKSLSVLKAISNMRLPNIRSLQTAEFFEFFKKKNKTDLWVHNKISNFEYLMHLNVMSGRSFNDLSQYPIFPWIISNYSSESIDLCDNNFYRDLAKPIGALNEAKLAKLKDLMKDKNYLYENSLSTAETVYLNLFRIEPFSEKLNTNLNLNSIQESFNSVLNDVNDNRELTPEFFYDFEFLKNSNKIDGFDDVILPPWSNNSRFTFIYTMRKALESDIVSETLNDWIDLVWGYKQRGSDAIKANNVFKPSLYEFDEKNQANLNDFEESMSKCGQLPSQLFTAKHPSKLVLMKFEKQPFSVPFTVHSSKVKNVSLALIDMVGDWQFKVIEIDHNGQLLINVIDLSHKKPKLNRNVRNRGSPHFPLQSKSERCDMSDNASKKTSSLFEQGQNDSTIGLSKVKTSDQFSYYDMLGEKSILSQSISDEQGEEKEIDIDQSAPPSPHRTNSSNPSFNNNGIRSFNSFVFKRRFSQKPSYAGKAELPAPRYNEDATHKNINISAVSKEVKGFSDIIFDVFQYSNAACQFGTSTIFFVSFQSGQLFSIDTAKYTVQAVPVAGVTGIAASRDYIAITKRDCVLDIYRGSLKNHFLSLPSYGYTINCCCLSPSFFTAIVGTRNGSLILYSINKGDVIRVVDLKGARPILVAVTNAWGFIVCYASELKEETVKYYLFVFTINGEFIKKQEIGFQIVSWCNWNSYKDFDYMAVSDEKGNLYAFEVFNVDKINMIYDCESKVVTLAYYDDISCIIAITKDGRTLFVPYLSIS